MYTLNNIDCKNCNKDLIVWTKELIDRNHNWEAPCSNCKTVNSFRVKDNFFVFCVPDNAVEMAPASV